MNMRNATETSKVPIRVIMIIPSAYFYSVIVYRIDNPITPCVQDHVFFVSSFRNLIPVKRIRLKSFLVFCIVGH